jgi:hypothetical protein
MFNIDEIKNTTLKSASDELKKILNAKNVFDTMKKNGGSSSAQRNHDAAVRGAHVVACNKKYLRDFAVECILECFHSDDITITHGRKILTEITSRKSDTKTITRIFGNIGRMADDKSDFKLDDHSELISALKIEHKNFKTALTATHKTIYKTYKIELTKLCAENGHLLQINLGE